MPTMSLYVAAPLLICLLVLLVVRSRRAGREIDAESSASFASMVAPYGANQPVTPPAPTPQMAAPPAPPYAEPAQPPVAFPATVLPGMPMPSLPADPYAPIPAADPAGAAPAAAVMTELPIPPAAAVIPQQSLPQPGELVSFGEPAAVPAFPEPPVAQAPAFPEPTAAPMPAFPEPAPAPVERPFPDPDFMLPPVTILPGR